MLNKIEKKAPIDNYLYYLSFRLSMDHNAEIIHLGTLVLSENLTENDEFKFENLEDIEILPTGIHLSGSLYKGHTYIVFPANPSEQISGVRSTSKGHRVIQDPELGITQYFYNAFSRHNHTYNLLVLFDHPIKYYMKALDRTFSCFQVPR